MLEDINLIIFPNWLHSEEEVSSELAVVLQSILTHPEGDRIALFVYKNNSEVEAELLLSGVVMNLLLHEDLDFSNEPTITILDEDNENEWLDLLPYIHFRVDFNNEDEKAIAALGAGKLPVWKLANFDDEQVFHQAKQSAILQYGDIYFQKNKYEDAIRQYQKYLEFNPVTPEIYFKLSESLINTNHPESAILILKEGIKHYPKSGFLYFHLIKILQQMTRIQEAISFAEAACQLIPQEYVFKLFKNLFLPNIYNTTEEINYYRQLFIKGLQKLINETILKTPEDKQNALIGIGSVTNFFLAYQGHNDVELQSQYGNLVHQIMAANYPQWVKPLSMPPLKQDKKIRVGYASFFIHAWSGTFLSLGYLQHCNKDDFEVYSYYIGNAPDYITQAFRDSSDVFYHIPHNLEKVCQQIIADELHILVFPELGMDASTFRLAGLRLAPVQCMVWGHPVTSGLPTMDYFLSSDLMEPENGQLHYSEKLIRLPNIGVYYPKPFVPELTKTRSDFQLKDDAVVYLSCQAPYKYLPQYDYIFAEIALGVPQAQFMFLRSGIPEERLQRAFAAVGLNYEDYCVFLPVLPRYEYLMLNVVSDIYLDTLSWSGGNTTLDALACNLPVVTCPGEFMRGRHSYAFLKRLEIPENIAKNEAEYIDIAVRLGLDANWRSEIREKIKSRHNYLYEDKESVEALEAFYQQVVKEGGNLK